MVSNYLTMLCKDILSIIYIFEHHNDIKQIKNQIYEQVERNDICFDFSNDRKLFCEYVLTNKQNIWKYQESSFITKGDFLKVEDYFKIWFYDLFYVPKIIIFSFINGEVYIVEELRNIIDKKRYKLTKFPYFKSRRDVYEKFRPYFRSIDEVFIDENTVT